ncbi:MAG: histone deacetylase family protein [Alphaproteobacteria bacterium]
MDTILFTHRACLEHDPGSMHPECPDRLRAVLQALEGEAFQYLDRREAPCVTRDRLTLVHDAAYVESIMAAIPVSGRTALDADTKISPGSGEAALRAAGACVAAVDAVMAGPARHAFCAVRPPGHHAERATAMGFCLFNNVAVAAAHARDAHNLDRVAVIDFDVHHGNGTQAMFWNEPGLFYASTHESPLYPGTGLPSEHGATGNIVNAPLPPLAGSAAFRAAMESTVLPAMERFRPQFVLISAGFDGHVRDPLASLELVEDDYDWATRELAALAARHAEGRIVSTLEGGYDLYALGASAAAHVKALMET